VVRRDVARGAGEGGREQTNEPRYIYIIRTLESFQSVIEFGP